MKAGSKLTKKEEPKGDNTNGKEIKNSEASSGLTTPEIMARSRKSLEGISMGNDEKKDQQMELMTEQFMQQQRELEDLKKAPKESQEQRQATSKAYREISERLTNSVPITSGPNINKPRVPRPQDTAYQAVMKQREKEQEHENEPTNDGREMLKLFTHLTSALKDTAKSDVNMPPKF
jgi:hypothetical protein